MSLDLRAVVTERDVDVALTLAGGETLALLGPNGAGKSTVLAALAGTLRPDEGHADLDGRRLFATGPQARPPVWLPPHERDTALLAQEALLFPRLTVLDNVAFGPRSRGASRRESRETARAWLADVDALDLAARRPAQLSGGQAQRVAVARALATDPRLLLLDEPMAALDVSTVPALRTLLRRVLADRTTIVVTHDVVDALLLADRVAVIEDGRVMEHGPTREVLGRPRSDFGARVAGLNLVRGVVHDGVVRSAEGLGIVGMSADPLPDGAPALAVFSPAAVAVHVEPPGGSPRNVVEAVVRDVEPQGALVRVRSDHLSADVTAPVVAELDLAPGHRVHFVVKAAEVTVYRA